MTRHDTSTETFIFTTRLVSGREHDYELLHRAIPSDLDRAMRAAGVVGWSIQRSGVVLTHRVEVRDRATMEKMLDADPVNLAWQREVAPLLAADDAGDDAAAGIEAAPASGDAGVLVWDFAWPTR